MTVPTTEQLLGGGAQVARFEAPGSMIEGTIVIKDVSQETDYKTGEKKFYERSGDPIWQIIATLETNLHEDDDDDGLRRVYIKSRMFKTLQQTLRDQKLKDIEVGGWLRIVHTGLGIPEGGGNAPKLYTVEYRGPNASAQQNVQAGLGGQVVPQQQPAPMPAGVGGYGSQPYQQNPQGYPQPQQQAPAPQPQYQPPRQPLNAYQQAAASATPIPNPTQPTPEQVKAVEAAGIDPAAIFPGYVPQR